MHARARVGATSSKVGARAGRPTFPRTFLAALFLLAFLSFGPSAAPAFGIDELGYAGSDRCGECHAAQYDGWKETFHATAVRDAKKEPAAIQGDFTAPNLPFTRDDVEYVIGGHWDQQYMKRIGDDYYILPRIWSMQSQQWRAHRDIGWQKIPYSKYCKGCHVTAYDPTANVPVAENRIGCEACHGPGWAHAEGNGEAPILNPRDLPNERRDMICAACHVRGKDLSETYLFPVGYIPGEDLGDYYVPLHKGDDESNTQAILRLFRAWQTKRANGGRPKCDSCLIPGIEQKGGTEMDNVIEFCFSCHAFQETYAEHHRHPNVPDMPCLRCHVQRKGEIMNVPATKDVHSLDYFLVHEDNCYNPAIDKSCLACHPDKDLSWARTLVYRWRDPRRAVRIEH